MELRKRSSVIVKRSNCLNIQLLDAWRNFKRLDVPGVGCFGNKTVGVDEYDEFER